MPGLSSLQVLADAVIKGVPGIDTAAVWDACSHFANSDFRALPWLRQLKYVPADRRGESVSESCEISNSDGHLALLAKFLGKHDDAVYFAKRGRNYQLYWDPDTKFLRAKLSDGSFVTPFNPENFEGPYTEGTGWMYAFGAPHDASGMIKMFGGEAAYNERLDLCFSTPRRGGPGSCIGQWWAGNEHDLHYPYMCLYGGRQWKTASLVREAMEKFYKPIPNTMSDNDDCGTMSTWYMFGAIGFYPAFPASCEYVFGSPALEKVVLNLPNGKKFTVTAPAANSVNRYIQSATLNGVAHTKCYITHAELMAGGELAFVMGPTPNESFGSKPEDRPHSTMDIF